jgi:hypothetical protein
LSGQNKKNIFHFAENQLSGGVLSLLSLLIYLALLVHPTLPPLSVIILSAKDLIVPHPISIGFDSH